MKNLKFKKLTALLLTSVMVTGVFSNAVFADGSSDGWDYTVVGSRYEQPCRPNDMPSSYTGLGYFLKTKYNLTKQIENYKHTMALGGLDARIIQNANGKDYLKLEGYYEIAMDNTWCWTTSGTGDTNKKSPYADPRTNLDYGTRDNIITAAGGSMLKDVTFQGLAGGITGSEYVGPDGTIPIKIMVGQKEDLRWNSRDNRYYQHDELKVSVPANIAYPYETYYGHFSYTYELATGPNQSYSSRVNALTITSILGIPCKMEVTCNSFYPQFVESVGIIDKTASGSNAAVYKIKLNTNARQGGTYTFTFGYATSGSSGVSHITKDIVIYQGQNSTEVDLTLPANTNMLYISKIEGLYSDNMYRSIADWRFNMVPHLSTYELSSDGVKLNTYVDYNINTEGVYEFTYACVHQDRSKTYVTKSYNLKNSMGRYQIDTSTLPNGDTYAMKQASTTFFCSGSDICEVYLANVVSPDGVTKYFSKTIYTNAANMPVIPDDFSFEVNVAEARVYRHAHGILHTQINYGAPVTGVATLYVEYDCNGETNVKKFTAGLQEGYRVFRYGECNGQQATNGNQPLTFPGQTTRVKLLYIEDKFGDFHIMNQLLYCAHPTPRLVHCTDAEDACSAEYYLCDTCGRAFEDEACEHEITSLEEFLESHSGSHSLTYVARVEPTFDSVGYEAYYICDNCHKMFADAAGTQLITEPATIPMLTQSIGWNKEDGKWYYYNADGTKATGWLHDGGKYYYLDPENGNAMTTGWKSIDNAWYFFDGDGSMHKGWLNRGSVWYYLNADGKMATGWKKVDGVWYYFNETSGAMASGKWVKDNDKWYYLKDGGAMATGWQLIDGKYYLFDTNGVMLTGWQKNNNKWYYLNPKDGSMKADGWLNDKGYWYYFDATGAMLCNTTATIGGVEYTFDASGHML